MILTSLTVWRMGYCKVRYLMTHVLKSKGKVPGHVICICDTYIPSAFWCGFYSGDSMLRNPRIIPRGFCWGEVHENSGTLSTSVCNSELIYLLRIRLFIYSHVCLFYLCIHLCICKYVNLFLVLCFAAFVVCCLAFKVIYIYFGIQFFAISNH